MDRGQWVDGFVPQIMREGLTAPDIMHYIIVHGCFCKEWCDNLNTTLDDNKKLTLANGETVSFGPNMRMVFVGTEQAYNQSTPAFISRGG